MKLSVLSKLALMPGGGSKTNARPNLNKLLGIFGFISMDKNILKLGWACRCTFLSSTHLPVLEEVPIDFSAWVKPSAEPIAIEISCLLFSAARSSTRPEAS
ncbi:hypothetical protein BpHYR1_016971 [Brachionus plicatilis]|uniref:Uncharacterized protein n=1 Tax=Brachionus plicatilis TaxID=10195 RepID=A0A3M7S9P7_BRAPC|nr:hypothetical protein BpHYR1_016971 [Brachionus plicatilis]